MTLLKLKAVRFAAEYDGPVYIRVSRNDLRYIPGCDGFTLGKPVVLREGNDITVFATGTMVYEALVAAEKLNSLGISARVVNVSTLKPVDDESIIKLTEGMKGIITAEEHSIIGGLAVSSHMR